MLPVLARFNGSPEVDAGGQIRYVFPDLQQTATVRATCCGMRATRLARQEQQERGAVQGIGDAMLPQVPASPHLPTLATPASPSRRPRAGRRRPPPRRWSSAGS